MQRGLIFGDQMDLEGSSPDQRWDEMQEGRLMLAHQFNKLKNVQISYRFKQNCNKLKTKKLLGSLYRKEVIRINFYPCNLFDFSIFKTTGSTVYVLYYIVNKWVPVIQ
jgi:hypothetical protein